METIKNKAFAIQIGTAITVLMAVTVFASYWTARIEKIEATQRHLMGKTDLYTERYEETLAKQREEDIVLAQIRTKLANIEVTLAEIKQELK